MYSVYVIQLLRDEVNLGPQVARVLRGQTLKPSGLSGTYTHADIALKFNMTKKKRTSELSGICTQLFIKVNTTNDCPVTTYH